jgi:hypothetical protein
VTVDVDEATGIHADPVEEARRILGAAAAAGVALRAVGGVAVRLRAPSIAQLLPRRDYHDIDLAGRAGTSDRVTTLLEGLGYEGSKRFNTMNGRERLMYWDPVNGRRIDVFLDDLRMCHTLPFRDRLTLDELTLTRADLALMKLQIVQLTERDGQDLLALFADCPLTDADADGISLPRILDVCANDWGWWKTVTLNLDRLLAEWPDAAEAGPPAQRDVVARAVGRARLLREHLDRAPKSRGWRLRAAIGERRTWYELPEEIR